ncbi:MAG: CRISPR-associated RAMP protein Csx10 [Coleofasciculaceae cyanobacterium]
MKQIKLTITALSALAIGKQKSGGSISEAESYIPGSVIRGAIAFQILRQANQRNSDLSQNGGDFQSLFLAENSATFQNAYPAIAKVEKDTLKLVDEDIYVLPATAVSSKTNPGFKSEDGEEKGGVFDTLIDRFCAEAYNHPYDPNCPKDNDRVEPFSGFYSKNNSNYRSHSVTTRFLTRVGINRKRATAEDNILYSIEVLNESFLTNPNIKTGEFRKWEPFVYRSSIFVNDDNLVELLLDFINKNDQSFRLGGSISRGLGRVRIEAEIVEVKSDIERRLKDFNDKLHERWKSWKIFDQNQLDLSEDCFYFTLDLQSDAIFTEQWQRTTVISKTMLEQFTGVEDSGLKLEVAYSSYDYRSGWNAALGLMKDMELITNRGAVYLFSASKDKWHDWIEALGELEMNGVGDRTCEGFGQVQVCNEFHNVFREAAV